MFLHNAKTMDIPHNIYNYFHNQDKMTFKDINAKQGPSTILRLDDGDLQAFSWRAMVSSTA